jgi:iron-sulfur cluster assembly accessory protein
MTEHVTLSGKAAEKILEIAKKDKKEGFGLKLYVFPGGCSGYQYGMDFEEKPKETDIVIEQHGLKLFIEKKSLDFVKGASIELVESDTGIGFRIENPNAGCGCGKSSC